MKHSCNRLALLLLCGFVAVFFSNAAMAQHQHDHGGASKPSVKPAAKPPEKGNIQSRIVEGLKVTFEVMSMGEHTKHAQEGGGHSQAELSKSHTIMVTLQDSVSKEIISDAKVQYGLTAPSGAKETGKLEWSGDHYGGGFNAKEKGTYRVQLKVESGGMEREAIFTYAAK
jgi:hypothetical protein